MKINILFLVTLSCVLSCKKEKEAENPYFVSNKNYEEIIDITKELKNDSRYYYIFNYSDTIIVTSTKEISGCIPCGGSKKIGSFNYKNKTFIITEPINPTINIIKSPNLLTNDNRISMIDTKVTIERHPTGVIYKIDDRYKMKKVYKGDVSEYLNKYEYQLHPKD